MKNSLRCLQAEDQSSQVRLPTDDLPPDHSIDYLLMWFGLIVDQDAYYILFIHWRFKTIPNEVYALAPWNWKPHRKLRKRIEACWSQPRKYPPPIDIGKTWADYMFPVML